jgi:hypothetical protein
MEVGFEGLRWRSGRREDSEREDGFLAREVRCRCTTSSAEQRCSLFDV